MSNANQPVHPQLDWGREDPQYGGEIVYRNIGGLTKREWLAGMAMQGIMANAYKESDNPNWIIMTAKHSIEMADALLKELEINPIT